MSILKQLEEPNFKATKSDKVLIEYIKENIEDVFYKSISQISKESGKKNKRNRYIRNIL